MLIPTWPTLPRTRTVLLAVAAAFAVSGLAVSVEALLRARLDGASRLPARLYARPLVLQQGTRVDSLLLIRYLRRMGYRRVVGRRLGIGEFSSDGWSWAVRRPAFRFADVLDPGGTAIIHLDNDGRVAGLQDDRGRWPERVVLEPEPLRTPGLPGDDQVSVRLSDVPPHLVEAVLAVEDRRFFDHAGVDVARIIGAALANLRAMRIRQGGSTITQQLVKNLFLSAHRTPLRKIREVAMALALERRHTKEEILHAYLNEIYLGQDGAYGVRGVGRAAQFYFGKDVTQLGLAESALLAALIRGPNLYNPERHPEAARERRDLVLGLMRAQGRVTDVAFRRAVKAPLVIRRSPSPSRAGRYFGDYVAAELAGQGEPGGGAAAFDARSGLTVFTTMDMELQLAAEAAVRAGVARLERDHEELRREGDPLQAALVALDPTTGEILAMVGGRDYGATQFNRATEGRRQPGSAFKPIVALAALSSGRATLASRLDDAPLSVETPRGLWEPVNYDGRYRGPVTLRRALEASLNVPFARLGLEIGAASIAVTGRKLGITSPLRAVPSLALGSSEVTPLELARAYGVLAAQGFRADLRAMLGAVDAGGNVVRRARLIGEQVFTPAETYLVTSALEGAVEQGTGRGLRSWGYWGPIAAKSGTTNDYRDAWFVGYTPRLVVAVWVGFDDGTSLGLSGAQAALPIFARFLTTPGVVAESFDLHPPPDLEIVAIDPATGLAVDRACGTAGQPEYFLPGTAPPVGEECWGLPDLPRWIADANARASAGVRSLIEHLRRRLERLER
jgi:penicillin-binding protein 1B